MKLSVHSGLSSFKEEFISISDEADLSFVNVIFMQTKMERGAGHMTSIEAGTLASKASVKQLNSYSLSALWRLQLANRGSNDCIIKVRLQLS